MIIHEIIHFIRRLKGIIKEEELKNKKEKEGEILKSPLLKKISSNYERDINSGKNFEESIVKKIKFLEGGVNLIYYLFGKFVVADLNYDISLKILDIKTWDEQPKENDLNKKYERIYNKLHNLFPNDKKDFIGIKFTQTDIEYEEKLDCLLGDRDLNYYFDNKIVSRFNVNNNN